VDRDSPDLFTTPRHIEPGTALSCAALPRKDNRYDHLCTNRLSGDCRRRLPRFGFDSIDGGAYAEHKLRSNVATSAESCCASVLKSVANPSLETKLLNSPEMGATGRALGSVGATCLCALRGLRHPARKSSSPTLRGAFR
jgi:hypothetical protein